MTRFLFILVLCLPVFSQAETFDRHRQNYLESAPLDLTNLGPWIGAYVGQCVTRQHLADGNALDGDPVGAALFFGFFFDGAQNNMLLPFVWTHPNLVDAPAWEEYLRREGSAVWAFTERHLVERVANARGPDEDGGYRIELEGGYSHSISTKRTEDGAFLSKVERTSDTSMMISHCRFERRVTFCQEVSEHHRGARSCFGDEATLTNTN